MKFIDINLQLFATAVNVTTANTSGNDLSVEMKTFYSDYLIDMAKPNLVHTQFGQKHNIPKNNGKTIEFRKYSPLPKATTPLTEGVTPNGRELNVSSITATVAQYGDWVGISDMLDLTAIDNNIIEATKLLGTQAGQTIDTIHREILNGGTSVQYGNGTTVTSRANLTANDKMSVEVIERAVRFLKTQNAPKINGDYVGIIHPDVAYDLRRDPAWIDAHKYARPEELYDGEIGKIAGVRFVETTEAKVWANAAAGNSKSVYSTLFLGDNAYGVTEVTGGGLQTMVKQLGSAGTADPLNQRATVGWKVITVLERLVETYMLRVETTSTFDSPNN